MSPGCSGADFNRCIQGPWIKILLDEYPSYLSQPQRASITEQSPTQPPGPRRTFESTARARPHVSDRTTKGPWILGVVGCSGAPWICCSGGVQPHTASRLRDRETAEALRTWGPSLQPRAEAVMNERDAAELPQKRRSGTTGKCGLENNESGVCVQAVMSFKPGTSPSLGTMYTQKLQGRIGTGTSQLCDGWGV